MRLWFLAEIPSLEPNDADRLVAKILDESLVHVGQVTCPVEDAYLLFAGLKLFPQNRKSAIIAPR